MLERLEELPEGITFIKEIVLMKVVNLLTFSTNKEIAEAWNDVKKKAIKV
jgi:hypothetical protein